MYLILINCHIFKSYETREEADARVEALRKVLTHTEIEVVYAEEEG